MDPQQERTIALLLSHRAMLLGYITSIVRDPDLAEDVFQNVAVVVLDKAGAVEADKDFPAWVRGVARLEELAADERLGVPHGGLVDMLDKGLTTLARSAVLVG